MCSIYITAFFHYCKNIYFFNLAFPSTWLCVWAPVLKRITSMNSETPEHPNTLTFLKNCKLCCFSSQTKLQILQDLQ